MVLSDNVLGHEEIKAFLFNLIASKRTGAPLLFSGPAGVGKGLIAREFAGSLLGDQKRCCAENHPDLQILRPQGKAAFHPIESVRQLASQIALDPLEGAHKVCIIEEVHRMGVPAANALLKTLEEPASNTLLILITHRKGDLLPTIRSRCRILHFAPLSSETIAREVGEEFAPHARGSLGGAHRLAGGGLERLRLFKSLLDSLDDYPAIKVGVEQLASGLEGGKKETVKALRSALPLQDLPAAARAAKELEIEGRAHVGLLEEVEFLLAQLPPEAMRATTEAYTTILRGTRLTTCLEALFLQLAEGASASR